MNWLQRIALALGLIAAIGVLLLDWDLVWNFQQFAHDTRKVEDLNILVLLMFGIAGLYSILFLVAPFFSAGIMRRESERIVASVLNRLRETDAPAATPKLHYEYGCELARDGKFREAARELEFAFASSDRELVELLSRDIDRGGPLHEFAATEPFEDLVNRFLMEVSIGA